MGSMKDAFIDSYHEEKRNRKVAKLLGIEPSDLEDVEYEIETHSSKDGMVYEYEICFDDDTDEGFFSSISLKREGNSYFIQATDYENNEPDEEQHDEYPEEDDEDSNETDSDSNLEDDQNRTFID